MLRRLVLRTLAVPPLLFTAWLALVNFPQPLFHYHKNWSNVRLYSDAPIPDAGEAYVDSALARLSRSPWNDATLTLRVFMCQSRWRFALLAADSYKVGGQTSVYMTPNIWIRPVHWETGRVVNFAGSEVPGDRGIAYYLAHEMTHVLTVKRLGRWRYFRTPSWKREGYADYIGRPRFDFAAMARALRDGEPKMDPLKSGYYWRYQLFCQYLLDQKHLPVDSLFSQALSKSALEQEIRSLPR